MNNALARQYGFGSLLRFALPNIAMMVFLSLYTVVDGIFVSRYAGTLALSASNMVYPVINVEMAVGIMLTSGGSAVIARRMGEGDLPAARRGFSLLLAVMVALGLGFALIGNFFIGPIVRVLGASEAQFELCCTYGRILLTFAPMNFLQIAFQTFFVAAGRPGLGLLATVGGGLTNMVFDYLLIVPGGLGLAGAAIATGMGFCVPAFAGLAFFAKDRGQGLCFVRPVWNGRMLAQAAANGSSEMVSNVSNGVTTFLFNYQFLRFYGEDGVAAITITLYFQFIFTAIYFGYSMGIAPIISYKYGAQDRPQLKKLVRSSLCFLAGASVFTYLFSLAVLRPALAVFTGADNAVFDITLRGFPLFALSFLLMAFSIFGSSLFTALSNGRVSAVISFGHTLVFLVAALLLLPRLLGESGLWLAVSAAEVLGALLSAYFLLTRRGRYGY